MRIQKLLLIVSVAGLSTFLVVAQSSDSEAQEKALKALREKMKDLDNAKPATPAPISKPQSQPTPAPAATTKRVEMEPAKAVASGDTDAQAKAMEALRKKQAELDAQQSGTTPMVVTAADAEAQAKALEALRKKQAELDAQQSGTTVAVLTPADEKAQAVAAQALRVKEQELVAKNAAEAARQTTAVKQQSRTSNPVVASPAPTVRAVPAAAVGLTADQLVGSSTLNRREKLDALLGLYLADTITPREYHQHRAAIVAQP